MSPHSLRMRLFGTVWLVCLFSFHVGTYMVDASWRALALYAICFASKSRFERSGFQGHSKKHGLSIPCR